MTKQTATYTVEPFPAARQLIAEAGRMGARRSMIHGLLEIDVTHARTVLREHKAQTGESLSFTAFIVACLAQALRRALAASPDQLRTISITGADSQAPYAPPTIAATFTSSPTATPTATASSTTVPSATPAVTAAPPIMALPESSVGSFGFDAHACLAAVTLSLVLAAAAMIRPRMGRDR